MTKGPEEESISAIAALAPGGVATVLSSAAWDDYDVPVAPYAILVAQGTGRVLGEGAGATWGQVRDLMQQALADAATGSDADLQARRRRAAPPAGRHG